MRRGLDWAVLFSAAGLAACHPVHGRGMAGFGSLHHRPYTHVAIRLNCPDREGALSLTAIAADGRSCRYAGDGSQVDLSLLALNAASPSQALQSLETNLRRAVPADGGPPPPSPTGKSDHTRIDLPGLHIETDGDRAHVQLPGVSVDAGEEARVHSGFNGGAEVHADSHGAVIRTGGVDSGGADLSFLLATDSPGPTGMRSAGYVARGPAVGPIVVASFETTRSDRRDHDAIERLVNLNVGP